MRFLLGVLSILLLGTTALLANLLQCLSLLLYPFSQPLTRKINLYIAGAWWFLCVFCTRLCGIQVHLSGDNAVPQENALVIANHQAMADIILILCLAQSAGRLRDCKWFVKEQLKYMPGIGWGMLFIDCIFLKRRWAEDANSIQATFSKYRERKIDFWLISFLEGTRSNPSKREKSKAYAKAKKLPEFTHVMLPRTKGFLATSEGLYGLYGSVLDLTLAYESTPPSLLSFFCGNTQEIWVHCKRFDAKSLPKGTGATHTWVLERFKEKDQRLAQFQVTRSLGLNGQ